MRSSGSVQPDFHLSIGNFKVFKCFKERFAKDKFKIMNTFFQPFELNNILIFKFQLSRIKKSGAKVGINFRITKEILISDE